MSGTGRGDVLIIFGAAVRADGSPSGVLRRRVEGALAAAAGEAATRFLVTGAEGRYGPSEARVMARELEAAGVHPSRVLLEEAGTDTLSSAIRCARMLEETRDRVERVWVCSSRFHNPRCVGLLRLLGVRARAAPMPSDHGRLPTRRHLFYLAREVPAGLWDTALLLFGRLRGTTPPLRPPLG